MFTKCNFTFVTLLQNVTVCDGYIILTAKLLGITLTMKSLTA